MSIYEGGSSGQTRIVKPLVRMTQPRVFLPAAACTARKLQSNNSVTFPIRCAAVIGAI